MEALNSLHLDETTQELLHQLFITKKSKLDETSLRLLNTIFEGDGVLDRALEAIDAGLVTRCESRSGRVVWLVTSSMRRSGGTGSSSSSSSSRAAPLGGFSTPQQQQPSPYGQTPAQPSGEYVVLGSSCSCYDYNTRILEAASYRRYCKHILAVAIGQATSKYKLRNVTDEEAQKFIVTADGSP